MPPPFGAAPPAGSAAGAADPAGTALPAPPAPAAPPPSQRAPLPPVRQFGGLDDGLSALDAQLRRCWRQGKRAALLWLGVPPTLADHAPEQLVAMGRRLRHGVRHVDVVMQLGTLGFVVLLVDAEPAAVPGVGQRVRAQLGQGYRLSSGPASAVPLSLGWALYSPQASAEQLLRQARGGG